MPTKTREKKINRVLRLLREGQRKEALTLISSLLPADKTAVFEALDPERQERLLPAISASDAADILEGLDDEDAAAFAETLEPETLTRILDEMEPDEAADLLGDLDPELKRLALEQMTEADEVRPLLRYPDDTAGGIMTSEYYVFPDSTPAIQILRTLRAQEARDEEIPYIYAVDDAQRLTGVARMADLIRAHPEQPLHSIAKSQIVSINADADQEIAARLLERYDLMALPVLEAGERLVGVITADDAMAALEEEATEDIYKRIGILAKGAEQAARSDLLVHGPVWRVWLVRVPFLIIPMLGSMVAGAVIGIYEETLRTVVALSVFIPVIMDMGGNAGVQSTSIFIRGQALGHIDTDEFTHHLLREILVGLGMGAVLGTLAGTIATLWLGLPEVGLIVGLSLVIAMTLAVTLGFLIPYLLNKLGVDPAAGASPLITTIQDVVGLSIYFALATLLLGNVA